MSLCLPVFLSDNCQCKLLCMAFKQAFSVLSLLHRYKLLTTIIGKYLVEVCVSIPLQRLEGTDRRIFKVLCNSRATCNRNKLWYKFDIQPCRLLPPTLRPCCWSDTHPACQPAVTEPTTRKSGTLLIGLWKLPMKWHELQMMKLQTNRYGHQPCHVISCLSIRSLALY